jgi:hypothetical protein
MGLEDAVNQARREAARRKEQAQLQRQREQQEQEEAKGECLKAVELLNSYGREGFIRVEPAKWWHILPQYKASNGDLYRLVGGQRCWTLLELRDGLGDGTVRQRRILLLRDGSMGELQERTDVAAKTSTIDDPYDVEYVSTSDLRAVDRWIFVRHGESYIDGLRHVLAEAIVDYESRGIKRRD